MKLFTAILFSGASGFIALSYEILWVRFFSFGTGSSPIAFGLLLGMYLVGIAIGSRRIRRYFHRDHASLLQLLGAMLVLVNVASYLFIPFVAEAATIVRELSIIGVILVVPLATVFGAVFPLLSHLSIESKSGAGLKVSLLYLSNILGSTIGTIVTGFIFLHYFSFGEVSAVIALLGVLLGFSCFVHLGLPNIQKRHLVVCVLCFVVIPASIETLYGTMYSKLLFKNEYGTQPPVIQQVENRHGVISVTQDGTVYGSGAYDGVINVSLRDDLNRNGIDRVYLALLVHPAPKSVLEIGLSAGSWAQVLASGTAVEMLTAIEINPGYLQVVKSYPEVRSFLSNRKTRVVIDDGRRWLKRNPDRKFDLIVMNTTFHWRSNATNILSKEFLLLLKEHLNVGGIVYINSTGCQDVAVTMANVFDYVYLYETMVLGRNTPLSDTRAKFSESLENMRIDGKKIFVSNDEQYLHSFEKLSSFYPFNQKDFILSRFKNGNVITDDNMITEFRFKHCTIE